jgi:type II secretory ATPase GspE/PulE/Tfp pilus assembly ATPase PilB-like protein
LDQSNVPPVNGEAAASPESNLTETLVQSGLLSGEQLVAAQGYARDHNCDLRQAILELNLISSDRLTALAFEHLSSRSHNPQGGVPTMIPDRTELERDVRNKLQEAATAREVPGLVDQIIEGACECRATDVHLDPLPYSYRVRYRLDGQLHDVLELDAELAASVISRVKVASDLNIVDHHHAQDGRMTITFADQPQDVRVATVPTTLGEKVVIRILRALSGGFRLDGLGMSASQLEQLRRLIARPYGAVLIGGPVGSGKTTTLYSSLAHVNHPTRNIMTIEDPIEYQIPGVNQIQVNARHELTFGEGLRAILRQDPDVVMIGEIRDQETAQIGVQSALTGVLVLSSIHADDSASTIARLYNYGLPGHLLATGLLGFVAQRLIRTICPYCRVRYQADARVVEALGLDPREHEGLVLQRGQGCSACFQTGYLGRTGIFEIMEIGDELRDLILHQTPKGVLRQVAIDLGMQPLKRSAIDKVLDGTTTLEEAYRVGML